MQASEKSASTVRAVPVPSLARASCGLVPIDFADAYGGHVNRPTLTASQLARAMFERPPWAVVQLMVLRNRIVARFGLKTPRPRGRGGDPDRIGIFPILSDTGQEMVMGLDDRHLDFRIWVSVQPRAGGSDVVLSTLLRFNHLHGRIYLFLITPFHRLLSWLMLRRALAALEQAE